MHYNNVLNETDWDKPLPLSDNPLTWKTLLAPEKEKKYFQAILQFLKQERAAKKIIYPEKSTIFHALEATPFDQVSVVIIGQDPYHNPDQAHGLSFSVQKGIKPPPSLVNIFTELRHDCDFQIPHHGCLEHWAKQGVLLLNSILTVEKNKPQSHDKIFLQQFTNTIISKLNQHPATIVYLLWGSYAQKKQALIDIRKHKILTAPHPSPLSAYRGFLGCKHFSMANKLLVQAGRKPIDWQL